MEDNTGFVFRQIEGMEVTQLQDIKVEAEGLENLVDLFKELHITAMKSKAMYCTDIVGASVGNESEFCFIVLSIKKEILNEVQAISKVAREGVTNMPLFAQVNHDIMVVKLSQSPNYAQGGCLRVYGNSLRGGYNSSVQLNRSNGVELMTRTKDKSSITVTSDLKLFLERGKKSFPIAKTSDWKYSHRFMVDLLAPALYKSFRKSNILWKDIVPDMRKYREVERIPLKLRDIWESHSKQEVLKKMFPKSAYVPRKVNSLSVLKGYRLVYLGELIGHGEWVFQNMGAFERCLDKAEAMYRSFETDEKTLISVALRIYIVDRIISQTKIKGDGEPSPDEEIGYEIMAGDYIKLCKKLKKPVYARIDTYNQLRKRHDKASQQHFEKESAKNKLKVVKNSVFNALVLPDIFERIQTNGRLLEEARLQRHCVFSYASEIEADECAIYSVVYEDKRYTAEVQRDDEGNFWLRQLQGFANTDPPQRLIDWLEAEISEQNQKLRHSAS